MKGKYIAALAGLIAMCAVVVVLFVIQSGIGGDGERKQLKTIEPLPRSSSRHPELAKFIPSRDGEEVAAQSDSEAAQLEELMDLLEQEHSIAGEAILRFRSGEAFQSFLNTARALGIDVLGLIPRLRTLRVGFDTPADLLGSLQGIDPDGFEVAPNFAVLVPQVPEASDVNSQRTLVPFSNGALDWLGVTGNESWGQGVVVAVLDTGIDPHITFRPGQISVSDLEVLQTSGDDFGHGTAVASLIAGNHPGAPGIAPAASIISYPITNQQGFSDSFTMAQAIFDAVDSGAQIINISLGSQGDSSLVREAVEVAIRNDVVVVAAAGNEGGTRVSYPAAYEGVIGVGAVDSTGQIVFFSNTGNGINIAAPGVGIPSAWPGDSAIQFSGTSASTPLVSGTLAAIYSQNPEYSFANATDLLLAYANEAGPYGEDLIHGSGNLNVGRIFERNVPGIYDAAIASQTIPMGQVTATDSHAMVDVVVENRGTETLYNVKLSVQTGGNSRVFNIPLLQAGESVVRQAPIDAARTRLEGSVEIRSSVVSSATDRNPDDNKALSTVVFRESS
ncbi:MAG: S8 family serine peptidase [Verrucomicrobiota bacterium]